MSRLVRLYPASWRERYETEFVDLLAQRRPTLTERFDIVRGALDAHLHPQVRRPDAPERFPVTEANLRLARRLGIATLIGGAVWPAAWGVASIGPIQYDRLGAYRDGAAALPILLAAVGLLVTGLLGQLLRLPADARIARGSVLLATPFFLLYGTAPWLFPVGLIVAALLVVLAAAAWRSGAWPGVASLLVAGSCFGCVAIATYGLTAFAGDRMAGGALMLVGAVVLVPVWLVLGATLIRTPTKASPPPPRTSPPPTPIVPLGAD